MDEVHWEICLAGLNPSPISDHDAPLNLTGDSNFLMGSREALNLSRVVPEGPCDDGKVFCATREGRVSSNKAMTRKRHKMLNRDKVC